MSTHRIGFLPSLRIACCLTVCVVAIVLCRPTAAQDTAPVTVADSPLAWQLFQQATDQSKENPAEAARICQRLLDGFSSRVIPAEGAAAAGGATPAGGSDRFEGTVERVERFLRTHPTTLERYRQIEGPEAARVLTIEGPEKVARLYGLTPAGLSSHLAIAESDFHAGRFERAILRLKRIEGHPDLGTSTKDASAYWFLRGACTSLLGRTSDRELADTQLLALGLDETSPERVAIARFAAVTTPDVPVLRSPLTAGVPPESDERGWQPVWTEPLSSTPYTRLFVLPDEFSGVRLGGPLPRALDRAKFDGTFLVVAPSVFGDLAIVSDGDTVRAMDRLSHRTVWMRAIEAGRVDRDAGAVIDLASVAVGEGRVVVLPGYGFVNERGTLARVTCLDLETGAVRWESPLATLGGDEFSELFPVGEPVIADGAVYVLARKVTSRLETVEYILALDRDDGSLLWATYIAGAGSVNMQGLRPASRITVADGSVWVASMVGAIARLDASDGRTQWLQRFLVPVRDARYPTEAWELGGPALIGDWLFAVSPDQATVVQIERETGRIENTFALGSTNAWGTTRYILADGGDDLRAPRLFAVGGDIVAFDPDRPTQPLWTLSAVNAERFADRAGIASRTGIRGRVQIAGDLLVVPGIDDVLLVSRDTGRVKERIEIEGPANPVLVGPQLLLGQNASVTALMPAASAERLMRERIALEPNDAEGGLALLDLGLRAKRIDLCVEAANFARAAIDRASLSATSERAREELVVRLLRTAQLEAAAGPAGEPIHILLDSIVREPSQRVRQLLAAGEWLAEQGRLDDAVVAMDRVLAEPELASVPVGRSDETRVPASLDALARLAGLGERATAAMSRRDEMARKQVAEAMSVDAASKPQALRAVAESFPLTAAGVDAALSAAAIFADRQEWLGGWAVLQSSLRAVPVDARGNEWATRLVGASIDLARRAGWPLTATAIVDTALAERGDLRVALADGSHTLRELRDAATKPSASIGGEPGTVRELPGKLVRGAAGATAIKGIDGILTADGQAMSLLTLPDFQPAWKATIVDRDPLLLLVGSYNGVDAILIWQEPSDRDATASWIGLRDGAVLATTPAAGDLLSAEALLDAGRPTSQQMPNESPYLASQILPIIAGRSLVLVRRNGDIAAFDLADLSKPSWTAKRVLDQIFEVGVTDWALALGGQASGEIRPGAAGPSGLPSVVALSPSNGTVLTRTTLSEGEDVRWLRILESGEVIVGVRSAVIALDALGRLDGRSAPLRWRKESLDVQDSLGAWRFGRSLVLATAADLTDTMVAIDLATATIDLGLYRPPSRLDGRRSEIRAGGRQGEAGLVQFKDRLVAFSLNGEVIGEDAIAEEERDFSLTLGVADGVIVVSNGVPRQMPMADGSGLRFEYSYVLYRLSLKDGLRLLGPGIRVRTVGQRAERWTVVDGFVIVSTNNGSLAVPLPSASAAMVP